MSSGDFCWTSFKISNETIFRRFWASWQLMEAAAFLSLRFCWVITGLGGSDMTFDRFASIYCIDAGLCGYVNTGQPLRFGPFWF